MNEQQTEIVRPSDNKEPPLDSELLEEIKEHIESWQKDLTIDPIQKKLINEVDYSLLDDSTKEIIAKYLELQTLHLDETYPEIGKINRWNILEQQIANQYKEIDKIISLGFKSAYDKGLDELKTKIAEIGYQEADRQRVELEKRYYLDLFAKRCALDFIHHFVIEKLLELKKNHPQKGNLTYDENKFNI